MLTPKNAEAHLLPLKEELGHLSRGESSQRGDRGVRREELLGARKKTLWVETPKGKSFLEEIDFGLEGEEENKRVSSTLFSYFLAFLHFLWLYLFSP